MSFKVIVFLFAALFVFVNATPISSRPQKPIRPSSPGVDNSNLLQVAVLFRHGDRTITSQSWPTDVYYNLTWPIGYGQLINKGKRRHYELGQWLRQRYTGYLPPQYNATDIYVRTTDIDRTHMSAASNLAGLYRPRGWQVWNKDIPWQPIPIHTVPYSSDSVLAAGKSCAKHAALLNALTSDPLVLQINEDNAEFYEEVSNYTGTTITSFTSFQTIQSTLNVYANLNMYIPLWARKYWTKIYALSANAFQRDTWTSDLARLQRGPFWDYFLGWFDDVIDGTSTYKFLMLSAHDSTVSDILNNLQVFEGVPPEYASTIIWELRQKTDGSDGQYVNMYFKNSTHFEKLNPLGCDFDCDYEQYKNLVEPFTVDSTTWEAECADV